MLRASRAEWAERVERWRDSGLTAKEYASQTGLKASTLSYWKWRLGSEAGAASGSSDVRRRPRQSSAREPRSHERAMAGFTELSAELATVSASAAMLEVRLGELSVRIPATLDEATMTRVVRAVAAAR